MPTPYHFLLVAVGSALGGLARWLITLGFGRWIGTGFPWGTFVINITGSFLLGWLVTFLKSRMSTHSHPWLSADHLQLMLAVGFCGAYTTFSTFELESHRLLSDGATIAAAAYIALSVFLGLLAVRGGIWLAGPGVAP